LLAGELRKGPKNTITHEIHDERKKKKKAKKKAAFASFNREKNKLETSSLNT
jgi:hypothetical protein